MSAATIARQAFTVAAALLALGALAAGTPRPPVAGMVDVRALARDVDREEDHVTALELAHWIRAGRADLLVIDVRPQRDYEAYHIPGAERHTLEELATRDWPANRTIVLYSEGGPHAAQGWFFLRARGHARTFFLRGGLAEWGDEVLAPRLPAHPTAADREAFAEASSLARWFGGLPSVGEPAPAPDGRVPLGARVDSAAAHSPAFRRNAC